MNKEEGFFYFFMSKIYLLFIQPSVAKVHSALTGLYLHYILLSVIILGINSHYSYAQPGKLSVSSSYSLHAFPLVSKAGCAILITDTADAPVTAIAATALSNDIFMITGKSPSIAHLWTVEDVPVLIGTLGKSKYIDQLASQHLIPVEAVKDKWETFGISVINNPLKKEGKVLVIFGSDPRGTAFGVFELSRMMGISPFVWWADVVPATKEAIYVTNREAIIESPSVKYRGFFINDEDWGIRPWAAQNMDKDLKDIGTQTYRKVFELMLRLKANYLWPAMHPGTKAFWYYKENPKIAREYDIIMGSSHHEPMLRNTEWEWNADYKEEYGHNHGEWRYDINKDEIYRFFDDRVKQSVNNEAIYTIGMRSTKDGAMQGPADMEGKIKILENVIHDQREILSKRLDKPADEIPQVFCPYKEVLDIYNKGLKIPDDVTILWVDDNHGYIRRLPNPEEQKRSGGGGVYYHFSYWGLPKDYLWLSSVSPVLTSYEMHNAYALNAKTMWVFNVGDIKPAELELQFAMDLAWNANAWTPDNAHLYIEYWAKNTFGEKFAKQIASVKENYYRLAASGKPEHLSEISYSGDEMISRIKEYEKIVKEVRRISGKIPQRLKNAYFELIQYPAEAASLMNQKILYAKMSLTEAASGNQKALLYSKYAQDAYAQIQLLTHQYNKVIAGGKWDGMMDDHPRNQKIFNMPPTATADMIAKTANKKTDSIINVSKVSAIDFMGSKDDSIYTVKRIKGLGSEGSAITIMPLNLRNYDTNNIVDAPYADYVVRVRKGENVIRVKCLPGFPVCQPFQLRYALSVNGGKPEFINIAAPAESANWSKNVLRGYAPGNTLYKSEKDSEIKIRIYFPDPGLAVNSISVFQNTEHITD